MWKMIIIGSLFLLYSCKNEPPPLRVVFVGELTGHGSDFSVPMRNSVQMAFDSINRAGGVKGRPLILISANNHSNEDSNVAVLQRALANGDCFFIGPQISKYAEGTSQTIAGKDVLLITTMQTRILAGIADRIIRQHPSADAEGEFMGTYLVKRSYQRLLVFQDVANAEYSTDYIKGLRRITDSTALHLTVYPFRTNNFERLPFIFDSLHIESFDALLLVAQGMDVGIISQQVRKKNPTIKLLASGWSMTRDVMEKGGAAVNGMVGVFPLAGAPLDTFGKRYAENFRKQFGYESTISAESGYEAAMLLASAMIQSPTLKPADVLHTILAMDSIPGVREYYRIDKNGDAVRNMKMIKISNHAFREESLP